MTLFIAGARKIVLKFIKILRVFVLVANVTLVQLLKRKFHVFISNREEYGFPRRKREREKERGEERNVHWTVATTTSCCNNSRMIF